MKNYLKEIKNYLVERYGEFILFKPIFNFYNFTREFSLGQYSDWLINYQGGFIRRGLFGTFLLNLPLSPENILIFLTIFLSLIYLGYIITVCLIYLRNDQNFYSHLILYQFLN